MAKYGKKAQEMVERAMKKRKAGTLRSSSGQKVTDPKQAIAIGLSEARSKGGKVPSPKRKSKATGGTAKRKRSPLSRRKSTAKR